MLILELSIDEKIVKLIKILQKPQIIMQFGRFLSIAHYFTDVQILQINAMQVNVLALIFLSAEIWVLKWSHKDNFTKILNCVFYSKRRVICRLLLLFVLVLDFFNLIIKVLPCDI